VIDIVMERMRRWLGKLTVDPRLTAVDLLIVAIALVYALVGMRNFELRMASLHVDDGPILYAYALKNPGLFEGDFQVGTPLELRTYFMVITSAMVWIPALLWRYLDVDPYLTTWLITLVQGLSIGLSIYILTLTMVRERAVAVLAVIFAYVATPWGWGPANYGTGSGWNFVPYPAYLALAPVLLAFACLIRRRNKMALLLLTVAGLIHPSLTLYACAIVGIYWLWEGFQNRSPDMLRRLAWLVVVVIITVLPALFVRMTLPGALLPRDEIIAGMRHNQHIWPWGYENRWKFSLPTTLKWLVLAGLSWRWRAIFSKEVQRLWVAALVGVFMLGLSHVIGGVWQIPMLLNLIGLRSFDLLALISLPLVIYYWYARIRSGSWLGATLSLLCLALPLYAREYALFWPFIVGLLLVDVSQGRLSIWEFDLPAWVQRGLRMLALLVLVAWGVSFLAMPFRAEGSATNPLLESWSQFTWGVIGSLPAQCDRVILLIAVALLSLLVIGTAQLKRTTRLAKYHSALWVALIGLIMVLYGYRFLWAKWQEAEWERGSYYADMLDVQLWAREHTPTLSLFVTPYGSWRTMSLRRKLSPFTRESYAYVVPRQAKEYRDRLLDFYGISAAEGRELRGSRIYQMELDSLWDFEESDFLRFASEFGATHLVLPTYRKYTETPYFFLTLVYQNPSYVVYGLEEPSFDKTYSLPFGWQGADTVHIKDLPQTALPLRVSGHRGDFTFSHIAGDDGDVIQVSPVPGGADESEGQIVQFGWWLEDEENGLEIPPGHVVYLSLWARLSAPPGRAELFVQDRAGTWEKSSVPIEEGTSWQQYRVVREIRDGATEVILGVIWQPKIEEEWLEIRDMYIYVACPSRDGE
jgi:hypothetical protein